MAAVVSRLRRSRSFEDVLVVRERKQYCKQSQYVILAFGGRDSRWFTLQLRLLGRRERKSRHH